MATNFTNIAKPNGLALTGQRKGMIAAEAIGVNDAAEFWIPDAASLGFGGLQRLIYASIEVKKR